MGAFLEKRQWAILLVNFEWLALTRYIRVINISVLHDIGLLFVAHLIKTVGFWVCLVEKIAYLWILVSHVYSLKLWTLNKVTKNQNTNLTVLFFEVKIKFGTKERIKN